MCYDARLTSYAARRKGAMPFGHPPTWQVIRDVKYVMDGLVVLVFFPLSIRCKNGMNHLRDRVPHLADGLCQYAHQYNNKVLICKVRHFTYGHMG